MDSLQPGRCLFRRRSLCDLESLDDDWTVTNRRLSLQDPRLSPISDCSSLGCESGRASPTIEGSFTQLLTLRIRRIQPLLSLSTFVRAKIVGQGGWIETRLAQPSVWDEEIFLPCSIGNVDAELEVYGIDENDEKVMLASCLVNLGHEFKEFRQPLTRHFSMLTEPICLEFSSIAKKLDLQRSIVQETVNSKPTLEVKVLHGVNFSTSDTRIAICLSTESYGGEWVFTPAADGASPVWDHSISLRLSDNFGQGDLEIRSYQSNDLSTPVGFGYIPLEKFAPGQSIMFNVPLHIQNENHKISQEVPQLYVKLCAHYEQMALTKKQVQLSPRYVQQRQVVVHQKRLITRYIQRGTKQNFNRGLSPFVLGIFVKEARAIGQENIDMNELFIELKIGSVVMRTNTTLQNISEGHIAWNEGFIVDIPITQHYLNIAFYCKRGKLEMPIGHGTVDLTKLPWNREEIECEVRMMVNKKAAGIISITLSPGHVMMAWLELYRSWAILSREMEEHRTILLKEEEKERFDMSSRFEMWHKEYLAVCEYRRTMQLNMMTVKLEKKDLSHLRVQIDRATRLYSASECYVQIKMGNHCYRTAGQTSNEKGIVIWKDETVLECSTVNEQTWKIPSSSLFVSVRAGNRIVGESELVLMELRHKILQSISIPMNDGSILHLSLEALDFGQPFEVLDESPSLDVTVLSAKIPTLSDPDKACEPFVLLRVADLPAVKTSSKQGANPRWDETFEIPLNMKNPENAELQMGVYDKDKSGGRCDSLLGNMAVPLQRLERDRPATFRLGFRIHQEGEKVNDSYVEVKVCARGFGRPKVVLPQ